MTSFSTVKLGRLFQFQIRIWKNKKPPEAFVFGGMGLRHLVRDGHQPDLGDRGQLRSPHVKVLLQQSPLLSHRAGSRVLVRWIEQKKIVIKSIENIQNKELNFCYHQKKISMTENKALTKIFHMKFIFLKLVLFSYSKDLLLSSLPFCRKWWLSVTFHLWEKCQNVDWEITEKNKLKK